MQGHEDQLVSADNQNKADVAANRAREWFDRDNVDAIADLTNSPRPWPCRNWRWRSSAW